MPSRKSPISTVLRRKLSSFYASHGGVAAIEFAIIAPLLSLILLGLVDYGMAVFHRMELQSAVRAGAQYALIKDSNSTSINGVVLASTNLNALNLSTSVTEFCECSNGAALLCTSSCTSGAVRHFSTITGTYIHTWMFLPGTRTLSESITVRTQ